MPSEQQEKQAMEERRDVERRVSLLELKYVELQASIKQVVLEQEHVRELFGQRFTNVEEMMRGVTRQLETITTSLHTTAEIAKMVQANDHDIKKLNTEKDQLRGIFNLLQWMGIAGLVGAAIGIWKIFVAGNS